MMLIPLASSLTTHNPESPQKIHNMSIKRAYSEQTSLFTPVSKIDDGAVYFIRSAHYTDKLVWDMPNGNTNDGVAPILYNSLGWGNQRFIVKE